MKICIVTSNRSEWGLLQSLVKKMKDDLFFDISVIALGSHCSPHHGNTVSEIEDAYVIENLVSSDTNVGMCKSLGLAIVSLADMYAILEPEMILVLGDRYEIFGAAQVAYMMGIPIAHIHGGEKSGNIDDGFRDCITRLSEIHFCATIKSFHRVDKITDYCNKNIYHVGALGCDRLVPVKDKKYPNKFLVVLHPVTPENENINELFKYLHTIEENLFFILPNADAGRTEILKMVHACRWGWRNLEVDYCNHLPRKEFIDLLSNVKAIVGNSSAGIIEAPTLGIPTINIGSRQKGRERASSIIDCPCDKESIAKAFDKIGQVKFNYIPYQGGDVTEEIIEILKGLK